MASIGTIQKDLGIAFRDALRADSTLLAFNSGTAAKDWIFFLRPRDQDKTFKTPRIVVEPIDEQRNGWTADDKKQIFLPFAVNTWVDEAVADPFDIIEMADRIKTLIQAQEDSEGIFEINIVGSNVVPEREDHRTLKHSTVNFIVDWREP